MSAAAEPAGSPLPAARLWRVCALLYLIFLGAYAGASGKRLLHASNDNHYVHLAYGWLHGRLDLGGPPPHSNDWSQVDWLNLKDGRLLKGAFVSGSSETFRTLDRRVVTVKPDEIEKKDTHYYVSFPPMPGALMLPVVAVFGMRTNDVLFNVVLAPLGPLLVFLLLQKLRRRGDSDRTLADDLLLTFVFGVGSVYYFSSVRGEVWYTAHVVSVVCVGLYCLFALDARRPALCGLALGCGFLSRPEILFAAPLFLFEVARVRRRPGAPEAPPGEGLVAGLLRALRDVDHRAALSDLVAFALPIALLGVGAGILNLRRFGRFTEFGHTYLNVIQAGQIQKFGLFNLVYLGRNLACAFALTPTLVAGPPWIRVSWHGLAMWVTTPVLLYLLWPARTGPLHRTLWITVACVAIPNFFYQNSGWVQFGYRFSLDYLVLLMLLLAIGGRPFGRPFKALALAGFALNLFGAITFYWAGQFYFNSYFPAGIN